MTSAAQGNVLLLDLRDRPAWEAATQDALPGLTWGHAQGLAQSGLRPELAVVQADGARMTFAFHRRHWQGAEDIATLPGLSALQVTPISAAPFQAWSDFARRQGWVSGYLQLSPGTEALALQPPDRIRSHNALYVFDLQAWRIESSVGVNMRRSMKAGERQGVRFLSDPARIAPVFADLHAATRARSDDPPAFSRPVLDSWFEAEGVLAFAALHQGRIVAAQLGRRQGLWADLHLAGAEDSGRPFQAWLIWAALEHLRGLGVRWVNIGGYGRPGDGLHQMKARLGAAELPLRAALQIYDPKRFAQLCQARGADPDGAFFPPYRA